MTTDNFISKVNVLNGVYASKQREDHRMLICIYKTCTHMCFAEILVKDQLVDDYGVLEVIKVFEQLDDAQKYVMAHPRAALLPRKVIKHGKIKKQK